MVGRSLPCTSGTHGSSPRSNCVITSGLGPAGPAPGKETGPGIDAKDTVWAHPGAGGGEDTQVQGVMGSLETPWRGGCGHEDEDRSSLVLHTSGSLSLTAA